MQKLVEKLGFSESMASAVLWVGLSLLLLVVVVMLALWLVRTLRPSLNINGGARGGRPQRLAVTDAFPLDRDGRKLVIVRRDNTEHLLLIGGPNDLLVEGNITRHDRAARGLPRVGESEGEDTAAAIPAPMQAPMPAPQVSLPANFVQAPQPAAAPQASLAAPRMDDFERALLAPKPVARPAPPVVPAASIPAPPVAPKPVFAPPVFTPPAAPVPPPQPAQEVVREEVAATAPPVLTLESLLPEAVPVPPEAPKAEPVAPPAAPAPAPRAPAMSEMARRLNEALQKPMSGTLRPPFNRSIPPAPPTAGASATPMPPVSPVAPPAPPAPAPEPLPSPAETMTQADMLPTPADAPPKADMDLLEEEMARLLGRPAQSKKPDAS